MAVAWIGGKESREYHLISPIQLAPRVSRGRISPSPRVSRENSAFRTSGRRELGSATDRAVHAGVTYLPKVWRSPPAGRRSDFDRASTARFTPRRLVDVRESKFTPRSTRFDTTEHSARVRTASATTDGESSIRTVPPSFTQWFPTWRRHPRALGTTRVRCATRSDTEITRNELSRAEKRANRRAINIPPPPRAICVR